MLHVDDNVGVLTQISRLLPLYGHRTILQATSVPQALTYIPDELIQNKINLSIVDGKIGPSHGLEVAEAIRGSGLSVAIIAFSNGNAFEWGSSCDVFVPKRDGIVGLKNAIDGPKIQNLLSES